MSFVKAVKQEAKLRLAIAGPSGSGKTYTALAVASAMAGRIAVVDTEHGSASKYSDIFNFDVMNMEPPFSVERFIQSIRDAHAAGYEVVILDSLSQAWAGTGGMLEEVDNIALRTKGNSFAAWKQGTPIWNKLIDAIVQSDIHIIATMRAKQDYVIEQDERGKNVPKKLGMAPVMRDNFEYEFDVVLNMDNENNVGRVAKTRCPDLANKAFTRPGAELAAILTAWLKGEKHIEIVDVLGDAAVKYAAKQWNVSAEEAKASIQDAIQTEELHSNTPKDDFKAWVNMPAE